MRNAKALDRILEKARGDPQILAVLRFGSTARGDATPASDVDVCLVLAASVVPASFSEKRLDYLAMDGLDVSIFQVLPLYVRHRVLKDGTIEFVRDEDVLYDVAFRTAQAFEDFKHLYHDYLNQVARG